MYGPLAGWLDASTGVVVDSAARDPRGRGDVSHGHAVDHTARCRCHRNAFRVLG